MSIVLGIDTSNYTTSCAIYNSEDNTVVNAGKLLPVKEGERGIRQSDAVFHHVSQIYPLLEELLRDKPNIDAVCASKTPRPQQDSYMPCFTVGESVARSIKAALNVPFFETSHQQGHIMAALFSADCMELLQKSFLAFHVSGGTTEAILVTPSDKNIIDCEIVAETLDLNAGQLIDRIGVKMGLKFPCGKELEKLALEYGKLPNVKAVLRGESCSISGFENKLSDMLKNGVLNSEVAAFTLSYVEATISAMTSKLCEKFGNIPIVYAGGVMSNSLIRESLREKFGALFAKPEYSCDNAAGVALLGYHKLLKRDLS